MRKADGGAVVGGGGGGRGGARKLVRALSPRGFLLGTLSSLGQSGSWQAGIEINSKTGT
jgi:hypothetical protein